MDERLVTVEDLNKAAQVQKEFFVAKEEGKSLVSDSEIEKLAGVSAGAQANTIEIVKVNGVALTATGKAVDITVQTEEQVQAKINAAVSSVYKTKGNATLETLPTEDVVQAGWVYNMAEDFTTTEAFKDGAGREIPAGTNVVWTDDGQWDCLGTSIDTEDFLKTANIAELTEEELRAMYEDAASEG